MRRPTVPPTESTRVVRVRVLERGVGGVHVRLQTRDGGSRTAWVPDDILEVAKTQLQAGQAWVSPTDGGPTLGAAAVDLIGILCTQAPEPWQDALYEASWVGPAPTLPREPVPEEEPAMGWDPETGMVVALGIGAAVAFAAVAAMVVVLAW